MYSSEIRNEVIKKLKAGISVKDISEKFKISKGTIYNWKQEYNNEIKLKDSMNDEICNNVKIISKDISILIKQKKYEEALQISEQPQFLEDEVIQSQRVTILIGQKKYEEALQICDQSSFLKSESIQSQKVTILIKQEKYEEALQICDQSNFLKNKMIQSQRVTILIKQKKYKEALQICEQPQFLEYESIQSQKVTILIERYKYEEALQICEQPKFKKNEVIQSQRCNILIKQKKYEEALQICEQPEFLTSKTIKSRKKYILKKYILKKYSSYEEVSSSDNGQNILSNLLTEIYWNQISLEELERKQINEFEKTILKIAYYEKNNKQNGIKFIKEKKNLYREDKEKIKILNTLLERLTRNKTVPYDICIYQKYLNCTFNFELGIELSKNELNNKESINYPVIEKIIPIEKEKQEIINRKKEIKKSNIIVSNLKETSIVPVKKKNIKEKIKDEKDILIKDLFEKEILQVGAYLYLKMEDYDTRKDAIKAWDNLQILISKSVYDKDALVRMTNFLNRIKEASQFNFKIEEKRYIKYMK